MIYSFEGAISGDGDERRGFDGTMRRVNTSHSGVRARRLVNELIAKKLGLLVLWKGRWQRWGGVGIGWDRFRVWASFWLWLGRRNRGGGKGGRAERAQSPQRRDPVCHDELRCDGNTGSCSCQRLAHPQRTESGISDRRICRRNRISGNDETMSTTEILIIRRHGACI